MFISLGRKRLYLSKKEVIALIAYPLLVCILFLILINLRPVYQIEMTLTPSVSPLADLQAGSLRYYDRSVRKLLRYEFQQRRMNSVMAFQTKLAYLQSRQLVESYIDKHNLKPKIFPKIWDEESQTWEKKKRGPMSYVFSIVRAGINLFKPEKEKKVVEMFEPEMYFAVDFMLRAVRVTEDPRSGIVRVMLRWKDPVFGAEYLNGLVDHANKFIAEEEIKKVQGMIDEINNLLPENKIAEVSKAFHDHLSSLQNSIIMSDPDLETAFTVIDPAWAPETPSLKIPKIGIILLFIMSSFFTLAGIAHRRMRKYEAEIANKNVVNSQQVHAHKHAF